MLKPNARLSIAKHCTVAHQPVYAGKSRGVKRTGSKVGLDAEAKRKARIKRKIEERQADVGAHALQVCGCEAVVVLHSEVCTAKMRLCCKF